MNNNKLAAVLLFCAIGAQRILFQLSGGNYHIIPFASDLVISFGFLFKFMQLLYAYVPIPFVLFLFWGCGRNIVDGYGKLLLIRSHKKVNICIRTECRMAVSLLGVILFQTVLFSVHQNAWKKLSLETCVKILILYYLVLLSLVLLQFCIELYTSCESANIIVNLFAVTALILGNEVIPYDKTGISTILLFPNGAFASRNGILDQEYVSFQPIVPFTGILVIIMALIVISIICLRKKDIF